MYYEPTACFVIKGTLFLKIIKKIRIYTWHIHIDIITGKRGPDYVASVYRKYISYPRNTSKGSILESKQVQTR